MNTGPAGNGGHLGDPCVRLSQVGNSDIFAHIWHLKPISMAVVIHIGVGKTATTTLQRAVFGRHSQLNCIGKPLHSYPDYGWAYNQLTDTEPHAVEWRKLSQHFAEQCATNKRSVIFSEERFGYDAAYNGILAERLHKLFPNGQIVITTRSQYTFLPSYYAAHGVILKEAPLPHRGRTVSFDNWFEHCFKYPRTTTLRQLQYDTICKSYESVFGPERVHCLCFEELNRDRAKYIEKWCGILDIDEGEFAELLSGRSEMARPSSRQIAYNRFRDSRLGAVAVLARPFHRVLMPIRKKFEAAGAPIEIKLNADQREAVFEMFASQNVALAKRKRLDLAECGYPMRA